ncbi:hypothetical protein WI37_11300 [Burkholderia ubonensis]|nr:hypothetical protein WI37_11300 [Burkholderia ubonensis]
MALRACFVSFRFILCVPIYRKERLNLFVARKAFNTSGISTQQPKLILKLLESLAHSIEIPLRHDICSQAVVTRDTYRMPERFVQDLAEACLSVPRAESYEGLVRHSLLLVYLAAQLSTERAAAKRVVASLTAPLTLFIPRK